ncbi:MAG: hypothetical protein J6M38_02920 [Lentisphaeria bacterium]|uniref:hypothetical protein n=1 Tax=uncultured Victivallis sp. TaxID=354118 RepID=UPI001B496B8B|nr:hypothetical protein [uncultured Victivallis sp.]MBP3393447.1 hypothetical protein [Lentisphaeria bacterium]
MRRYLFPAAVAAAFVVLGIYSAALSGRCNELCEKQARQEAILLKQSEILAVNTVVLQTLVSSMPDRTSGLKNEKEGLRMEYMP